MTSTTSFYHTPVLCAESISWLITNPNGIYIDATMGGGGHSRAILSSLGAQGHLFGFDQDPDAREQAPQDDRFTFVASNFRHVARWMEYYDIPAVSGILADLGVSSHHFDMAERGFSFRYGTAIPDMRMNTRATLTAQDLLCRTPEEELARIFYHYGELTDARRLANLVVEHRTCGYTQIDDLIEALGPALPRVEEQRKRKLSRIFQALRIEVNGELSALQSLLQDGSRLLAPRGRFVVISYHSLEDRLVKDYFRLQRFHREQVGSQNSETPAKSLIVETKKPLLPSAEEIAVNPRSRSAKLRVATKCEI